MQEAYRPPRSKYLLCCSVFQGGGTPIQSCLGGSTPYWFAGVLTPVKLDGGTTVYHNKLIN